MSENDYDIDAENAEQTKNTAVNIQVTMATKSDTVVSSWCDDGKK